MSTDFRVSPHPDLVLVVKCIQSLGDILPDHVLGGTVLQYPG